MLSGLRRGWRFAWWRVSELVSAICRQNGGHGGQQAGQCTRIVSDDTPTFITARHPVRLYGSSPVR